MQHPKLKNRNTSHGFHGLTRILVRLSRFVKIRGIRVKCFSLLYTLIRALRLGQSALSGCIPEPAGRELDACASSSPCGMLRSDVALGREFCAGRLCLSFQHGALAQGQHPAGEPVEEH
jgi:hypothetical protein